MLSKVKLDEPQYVEETAMHLPKPIFKPLAWHHKIFGVALVLILLLLGIIGLILPILPGIVFLFLAFFVLTKISQRVAAYAHSKPWFNYHLQHLRAASGLKFTARCKLAGLYVVRGLINAADSMARWCKRKIEH